MTDVGTQESGISPAEEAKWAASDYSARGAHTPEQNQPQAQVYQEPQQPSLAGVDTKEAAGEAAEKIDNIRSDLKAQDKNVRAQTPRESKETKTGFSALIDRFQKKLH